MAERPRMLPLWRDQQSDLHAKSQVLALQGVQEAVHGHGRNADVLNPVAVADMGSCDLSDRVVDGNPAMDLSEILGVSCSALWHLGHRVRFMMAEANPILFWCAHDRRDLCRRPALEGG